MAKTLELDIAGMTCDHCVRSVTNALKDVPGVSDAKVDLEKGAAVVEGEAFEPQALIAAVEEEGYTATLK